MRPYAGREEKVYDITRFLGVVRERWWVVLLTMLVIGVAAFGISEMLQPRYNATVQLTYSPDRAELASRALSTAGGTGTPSHNILSDAQTIKTYGFAERVRIALGNGISPQHLLSSSDVNPMAELDIIEVKASGSDPVKVAEIANTIGVEFVAVRQEKVQQLLSEAQKLLDARIASLSPQEAASTYGISLKQQRDDLAVLLSLQIGDYSVLQEAVVPSSPYFPRPFLNLELGLFVGLILGLAVAVFLDHRDDRIKDQDVLERVTEMSVIGTVPTTARKRARASLNGYPAVGFKEGNEELLESMRMLRSNLRVLGFGKTKKSMLVTSAVPGAGKSTLAVNLALSMVLSGERVVLLDADLRNPAVDKYLNLSNEHGLTSVLADKLSLSTQIQVVNLSQFVSPVMRPKEPSTADHTSVSRFLCLTSGPIPRNPSEILESEDMKEIIAGLKGISNYLILDGPPMLEASDSLILSRYVDAVLLSARLGTETVAQAFQLKRLLIRAEIDTFGIVLSGVRPRSRDAYPYYLRPIED